MLFLFFLNLVNFILVTYLVPLVRSFSKITLLKIQEKNF